MTTQHTHDLEHFRARTHSDSATHTTAEVRPRVLLVDDEPHIREFLSMGFDYEGFETMVAGTGDEALDTIARERPDIVILDVMLPGVSGLEVARHARRVSDVGIIMLTARDTVNERIIGLETGADDYMTKPFTFKELLARVRAVLRRRGYHLDRYLVFQNVTLDRETHTAARDDREIALTPREFELLELLLMHPRQTLTRDTILARIWGYDYEGDDNVLEVYIRRLREKLDDAQARLVQTVRGVGYALRG